MLLTDKYAPKKIDEILGNEEAREKIKTWILNWIRGKNGKPIMVCGPSGIGKTAFAYAIKEELDLELVEMSASDFRDRKNIERILAHSLMAGTLSGKKKLILIDDVDILGTKDRGGADAILEIVKNEEVPVILTATNAWDKKISKIRMNCELISLKRVTKTSIEKLVMYIAKKEGIDISVPLIKSIVENANGDVRSAINDLQALGSGTREREKDIFNTVRGIFKAESYKEVREAIDGDLDYEIVSLWIEENIPLEYNDPEEVAKAYYYISRSDQFAGRIRKSTWAYLKYVIDFFSAGVALSKKKRNMKFVKYNFPAYLKGMSTTMQVRALMKNIGQKIGKKIHENKVSALEYMPIVGVELKKDKKRTKRFYDFTDDEVEFILALPKK